MLVQHLLEASAGERPDQIALVSEGRRFTYRELDTEANRLAHALREAGVGRGDRVVIQLPNGPELVTALFAVLKASAVFVILHADTKPDRLAHVLADTQPAALVADRRRGRTALDAIAATPLACVVWTDSPPDGPVPHHQLLGTELGAYPDHPPGCASIDADLATLIYTSGSTGQAKGVMASHLNLLTATASINRYLGNTAEDVLLNVLPLAFGYGLSQVLLTFATGGRLVLEPGFIYPAHTMALMAEEGVTGFAGVPTIFAMLLRHADLLKPPPPRLRYLTNAAAALPVPHLQQLRAALPGVCIFSMYGQTECLRVCYLPPEELDRRPGSVGIAIPNTEVQIVDEQGRRVSPGQVGELIVRGSHVTRGYWQAPELTAERFRQGILPGETVLHSGDLFQTDEEGFLYFVARKDDIIKSRGEKVSPREIENAVCQLEQVAEAVAVGVPDQLLGEAILLTVVPHTTGQLTEKGLRAHCARTLEDFKMPKYVVLAEGLPRTHNGKVDRLRLREDFLAAEVAR